MNQGGVLLRYWQNSRLQSVFWFLLMLVPASSRLAYGDATNQYLTLGIYALLAAGWLVTVVRRRLPVIVPRFLLGLFAYCLLMLVLVPLSPVQSHAWEILLDLGQLSALTIMVFTLFPAAARPDPLEGSLLLLGGLFSLANLVYVGTALTSWFEVALRYDYLPPFGYRLPGAFLGHPNVESGFIGLLMPFVLVHILDSGRSRKRLPWLGLLGFFLFIDFFTSSRTGWTAAAVGLAATGFMWFLSRRHGQGLADQLAHVVQTVRQRWMVAGGVVGLGLALAAVVWLQMSNTFHQPLSQARSGVWSAGWSIFLSAPVFGHGPGSTHLLVMTADRFLSEPYFIHPHNLLLYLADEGGIVALAMAICMAVLLVRSLRSCHRRFPPHKLSMEAAGVGALVTVAVHNMADVLFESPSYTIAVVMILVLVWSRGLAEDNQATLNVPYVAVVPLLAVCLAGQLLLLRGVGPIQRGVDLVIAGEEREGAQVLCGGATIRDAYAIGHFQCALALGRIGILNEGAADVQAATTELEAGLRLDPFWPANWANLGLLQWDGAQRQAGVQALAQAVDRAPHDPRFLATQGWMLESLGSLSDAGRLYETAIMFNPELTRSVFFQQTDLRRRSLLDVGTPTFKGQTEMLTWLGWSQLDIGNAASAVDQFQSALRLSPRSPEALIGLAAAYQALGKTDEAQEQADVALLGTSSQPRVLLMAGQIAYAQGRLNDARNLLEAGWKEIRNRNNAYRYYGIVYRRAYLPFDTLPGLIDPTLTVEMDAALRTLEELSRASGGKSEADEIAAFLIRQAGGLP